MALQASFELFERAASARGRILRVESDRAEGFPRVLALTFDVGRVVVRAEGDALLAESAAERAALPSGLVPLDEEDPWWRVLGQPITGVWRIGGDSAGRALALRFREPDQNPRLIGIAVAGPALRVSLLEANSVPAAAG